MAFLHSYGFAANLPLKKLIYNRRSLIIPKISKFNVQTRSFTNTHLSTSNQESKADLLNPVPKNILDFQRNTDEINLMETHSLTMSMMRSSKSGFLKKSVWDKYIARAIELVDKFSVKNISILMISVAKSRISNTDFYDRMSERLITKCKNYINTYKMNPLKFFDDDKRSEFTPFNIYTILSACSVSGYKNETLFRLLYKVSEIKIHYFNKLLDECVNLKEGLEHSDFLETYTKDDKFTFEDVAGILYVYSWSNFQIKGIFPKYSDLFKKMYHTVGKKEDKYISIVGELTSKSFAIAINSLVKLGDRTIELYNMGLEYLRREVDCLPCRDICMIFNSIIKIRNSMPDFYEDVNAVQILTNKIVDRLSGAKLDAESMVNISSTFVNIFNSKTILQEEIGDIKNKFNKFFTESIYNLVSEKELDAPIVIQLLYNSSILGFIQPSMILLCNDNLKSVGLTGTQQNISEFLTSLLLIYNNSRSNNLNQLINDHVVTVLRQYSKRLNYVLYPNTMGLSKTKSRPASLYNILKLESKGLLDAPSEDINNDWKDLTREISEYSTDNLNLLATMLNSMGKFKQCRDFIKFVVLSSDYIKRFFKGYSHQLGSKPLHIETISAIVNSLSRYRIKNLELMENFSKLIKIHNDRLLEDGNFEQINYVSLFNIINSYSKLGLPKNRIFHIRNNNLYKHLRKTEKHDIQNQMFSSICKLLLSSDFDKINMQMVTNCLYSLSLVGFDKFSRLSVLKLMERLIKRLPKESGICKRNSNENEYASPILDCIAQFDGLVEHETTGTKELFSQLRIVMMMLYLMIKRNYFKSKVFEIYLKRMKRVILGQNKDLKMGRKQITGDIELIENETKPICHLNPMSGVNI
uniref:Uncharacterized protein n=1 Tax=Theileria annulata TaxID=5874 RepID=A0A3B0MHC4_THEAN